MVKLGCGMRKTLMRRRYAYLFLMAMLLFAISVVIILLIQLSRKPTSTASVARNTNGLAMPIPTAVSGLVVEAKSYVKGGIGIELKAGSNGFPMVVHVIPGSPAALGGLQANDVILQADNQSLAGLPLLQAVERIRGFRGTSVQVAILRGSDTNPVVFTIHRASFHNLGVK